MKIKQIEMGLATPAMLYDDFSGLMYYRKNKIRYVEVTPVMPDNKAWEPSSAKSTAAFMALCKQNSVIPHSVHSYFFPALGHCMTDNDKSARENAIKLNQSLFSSVSDIGAGYIVIHLSDSMIHYDSFATNLDRARKALDALLIHAEKTGVKIAVENIHKGWAVSHINELLDEYRHPLLGICLDTGHAAIYNDAAEEIIRAGNRLLGFHVHDNNLITDQHLIPFRGKIDWFAVAEAVKQVGYNGVLTFESYTRSYPSETVESYIDDCRAAFDKITGLISDLPGGSDDGV
jgi:sugar phosphate isomerase/epimerase